MSCSGSANKKKGKVLYQRSSSRNSSDGESSDEMWDDRILTDVYDKAVSVAREQVAKRLAMNTNTIKNDTKPNKKHNHNAKNSASKTKWKVGADCRAVYSQDGLEYEATILYIDGDSCIIKYVGYNNEEDVKLSDLKPSLGKNERAQQVLDAEQHSSDDGCENLSISDLSTAITSEGGLKNIKENSLNKSKGNKNKKHRLNMQSLPTLSSFQFPQFPTQQDLNCHIPLPPPPPFLIPTEDNSFQDDQSLSTMLISWYMSGYYTGLYQGQKMQHRKK